MFMFWLSYAAFVLGYVALYPDAGDLSLLESVILGVTAGIGAVICDTYRDEIGETIIIVSALTAPVVVMSSFLVSAV